MAGLARRAFLKMLGGVPSSDYKAVADSAARNRAMLAERDRRGVASGVDLQFGQYQYEPVLELRGDKKWDTIDRMVADPHIKGGLNEKAFALLTAQWDIEPASDDPRDMEIAEFVRCNLLRRVGDRFGREYWTQTSWLQRLYEILGMLEHGFAMFHKSWRTVKGPGGIRRVYDRIQWLEPSSVDPLGWILSETDEFEGVYRTYDKPGTQFRYRGYVFDERVEADRLALYPWELRGARFEGRPYIRALYGPWYRKDFMLRMAAIWAQKVGAPVPVGYYLDDWSDEERDSFEEFIQSLRGTAPAEAYGLYRKSPDGQDPTVTFAGADAGEVDRMRSLIDGENAEIAHGSARKSQLLGETDSGSRALGSTQSKTDMVTLQAISEWVCEIETHGAGNLKGLIEELVDVNYAGARNYPRLVVTKIDPQEGLETIDQLVKAKSAGLVPAHPDLMKQVTERLGYSLSDDVYDELAEQQEAAREAMKRNMERGDTDDEDNGNGAASGGPDDDRDGDEADMSLAASDIDEFRRRIAPLLQPVEGAPAGGRFRPPNRLEAKAVNLAAVQETFRVGERDILAVLRESRVEIRKVLLGWLRIGKLTPRNIESLRQAKWRGMKRAEKRMEGVVRDIGRTGMEHVVEEVERLR